MARFLRAFVAPLLLAVYRTRFLGEENVPASGGFILAGNHVSYLDPALLWCRRAARDALHREAGALRRRRWSAGRSRGCACFPISRGTADRVAIQRATDLLGYGEPVGIFPEGTRQVPGAPADEPSARRTPESPSSRCAPACPWFRSASPVPTGRCPKGAKLPRFPRVTIRYGEPVRPEEFTEGGRKERTQAMTAEIMRRIAAARAAAEKE